MSGYYRRVGAARPSHLMFTGGVGALIDMPNFSVLVKGLESWNHAAVAGADYLVDEPRLRAAINRELQRHGGDKVLITELRSAPWLEGGDQNPKGTAAQGVGVPVTPFPQWLRCTACNELSAIDAGAFTLVNANPRTPHEARFEHTECPRRKRALAVAARFTLACTKGHLDEFPYVAFTHGSGICSAAPRPRMRMEDHGGNQSASVTLTCLACGTKRNIREATGVAGQRNLPFCRGRHPHLDSYAPEGCGLLPLLMVAGASNQWFPLTRTALALPTTDTESLGKVVEDRWAELQPIVNDVIFDAFSGTPAYSWLKNFDRTRLMAAIAAHRAALAGEAPAEPAGQADLLAPEWQVLSADTIAEATDDFALTPAGVPDGLGELFADVRQVDRLREARALIGFTRLDAPDPEDPGLVERVELSRSPLEWVPASEVRGEGIFVRVQEGLIADWVQRVEKSPEMTAHRDAFAAFRRNRRSDRIKGDFDEMHGWPGERYIALHTLSHLLIRTIALDCGYSSASLAERIYAGGGDEARAGILIYTAVPDSEGTLGGLVTLGERDNFERIVRRALREAARCSADPLCAERLPQPPAQDFLHGAACHICLFVSETTCERGNRFLDRRFLVPLGGDPALVLTPPGLVG